MHYATTSVEVSSFRYLETRIPNCCWFCIECNSTLIFDAPGSPLVKILHDVWRFYNNPLRKLLSSILDIFPSTKNVLLGLSSPHGGFWFNHPKSRFISWKIVGRPIAPLPIINPAAPVASIQAAADLASTTSPLAITGISTASTIANLETNPTHQNIADEGFVHEHRFFDTFGLDSLTNFQSGVRTASSS